MSDRPFARPIDTSASDRLTTRRASSVVRSFLKVRLVKNPDAIGSGWSVGRSIVRSDGLSVGRSIIKWREKWRDVMSHEVKSLLRDVAWRDVTTVVVNNKLTSVANYFNSYLYICDRYET